MCTLSTIPRRGQLGGQRLSQSRKTLLGTPLRRCLERTLGREPREARRSWPRTYTSTMSLPSARRSQSLLEPHRSPSTDPLPLLRSIPTCSRRRDLTPVLLVVPQFRKMPAQSPISVVIARPSTGFLSSRLSWRRPSTSCKTSDRIP